eukprot:6190496-Pleurochrysis_carterae.AAC.1
MAWKAANVCDTVEIPYMDESDGIVQTVLLLVHRSSDTSHYRALRSALVNVPIINIMSACHGTDRFQLARRRVLDIDQSA